MNVPAGIFTILPDTLQGGVELADTAGGGWMGRDSAGAAVVEVAADAATGAAEELDIAVGLELAGCAEALGDALDASGDGAACNLEVPEQPYAISGTALNASVRWMRIARRMVDEANHS